MTDHAPLTPDPPTPDLGQAAGRASASRPATLRSQALPLPLLLPALLTMLAVLLPLGYLLLRALGADAAGLRELVFRVRNLELLRNTVLLTLGVLGLSTALALPLAYLTTRVRLRPRRLLTLLCVLPLAIPGYVGVSAALGASGPGGSIQALTGLSVPAPSGYAGALIILSLLTFPYLYLNLWTALRGQDPALEDASRMLGRGEWQTFCRVTLPHLRPAWLAGALLTSLHVLGDFSVPSLMRYPTFSAAIYTQYTASFDRTYSAWLSLMLLALTGLTLLLEARLMRGLFLVRGVQGAGRHSRQHQPGWWAAPAWVFAAVVVGLALVVPLVTLVFWMRLTTLPEALSGLGEALAGSLGAAVLAAITTTALAFPLAYLGARYRGKRAAFLERTAFLGYATPPLALALALIFFSLRLVPPLYQTFGLLIAAYTLHFVAEAIGPLRSALNRASPRLEEAARTLGLSASQTVWRVTLPLVRSGLVTSLAFVFLSVLKELPLTLLLAPVGYSTLSQNVWGYTEEALYPLAAPYALTVVLAGAVFVGLLLRQRREL